MRLDLLYGQNSLIHPQECSREGDDAFGEELAGVAGAGLPTTIEIRLVVLFVTFHLTIMQ